MTGTTQRGRRAGGGDTRGEILAAARTSFAESGYGGTTVRGVAAVAGVDPALVHHYFGTKDDLFLAALEFPVDPRVMLASVVEGDPDTMGTRLVATALSVWDDPQARLPLLALVRSGVAGEQGRALLETALSRLIFGALGQFLDVEDSERRVGLVASQMVGLVITRYVLRLEPMVSMPAEEVAAWLGPTLQRYLTAKAP